MPDEKKTDNLSKKMEELREELRSKALKVTYEIFSDVQRLAKVKLTFEQFDLIFAKLKKLANDGYSSALMLILYAGNEL